MLQAMIIRKVSAVIFSKDEMFKDPGSLAAACWSRLWEIRQAEACYCVVADEAEGFFQPPLASVLHINSVNLFVSKQGWSFSLCYLRMDLYWMEDEHDFTKLYENENSEDSSALFQSLVICLIAFLDSCLTLTLS